MNQSEAGRGPSHEPAAASEPFTILLADDDAGDRLLAAEAMEEAGVLNPVRFVSNGEELLGYLRRPEPGAAPAGLVLLDLNMPRKDGREALAEMQADEALRAIRVVVMTTSQAEEDRAQVKSLGASGFISKPVTFEGLVQVVRGLQSYGVQFAPGS